MSFRGAALQKRELFKRTAKQRDSFAVGLNRITSASQLLIHQKANCVGHHHRSCIQLSRSPTTVAKRRRRYVNFFQLESSIRFLLVSCSGWEVAYSIRRFSSPVMAARPVPRSRRLIGSGVAVADTSVNTKLVSL